VHVKASNKTVMERSRGGEAHENYVKLVLGSENNAKQTVRESQRISCLKFSGTLCKSHVT